MNSTKENPDTSSPEEEAQLIELERRLKADRERLVKTVNPDQEDRTVEA